MPATNSAWRLIFFTFIILYLLLKIKHNEQMKLHFQTNLFFRFFFFYVLFFISMSQSSFSQTYENECKTILKLFESGKKDSAYSLIEPLKKKAPYSANVLYTRAQMTPDARAIGLYERIIALEPNGSFTERALYQLVRRHVENRDSLAASTWLAALRERFPNSANLKAAETSYNSVTSWKPELALPTKSAKPEQNSSSSQGSNLANNTTANNSKPDALITKTTTTPNPDTKPTNSNKNEENKKNKKDFITGIALQLGVFPTKEGANNALDKVQETYPDLRMEALPKMVDGKKMYALITGPYKSIDAAKKSAMALSGACNCKPFPVNVE